VLILNLYSQKGGDKVKRLKLQNLYTGGHRVKEVKNDFPVKEGQVISFNEDITDRDYKIYRVIKIEEEE